ncbi:tape measure protein [Klebsiella variicola]|uniref:tape measure protein n=1 Tax=Klebsiella variicola TaxID=244366 RepID=UPI002B060DC9|nr:tape measure protein [Klebsiella variicola]
MAQVGEIVYQVQMDVAQLLTSQRQLDQRLRNMEGGFDRTTRSVNDTENAMFSLSKAAALVTSALSAGAIIHAVDEWGQMAARIKMALNSVEGDVERYSEIQERFLEVSNRNGKAIETVQALYAGSATSMKELGYNTTQTVDYIESLSSAFTANATGAQQTESAMTALNRAMVVGVLKGNDWHSVLNATPSIVNDIAKELSRLRGGMKVTENDVKKMAMESGISMKLFADAVINARTENNALADSMDNTVADGFTKLANSAKAYFGELNQGLGVTRSISAGFAVLSDNFDKVAAAAMIAATVVGARYVGALSSSIKTKVADAAASVKQVVASRSAAIAVRDETQAKINSLTAERARIIANNQWMATQSAINRQMGLSISYQREYQANAARIAVIDSQMAVAKVQLAAATSQASIANRAYAASLTALKGGLALIGGPMGAAMLAGAAVYYFFQKAEEAKRSAHEFADSLNGLRSSMDKLTRSGLSAKIAEAKDQLDTLTQAQKEAEEEVKNLNTAYKAYSDGVWHLGSTQEKLETISRKLAKAEENLERVQNDRSKTINFIGAAQAQLNGELLRGEDLLKREAGTSLPNAAAALRAYGLDLDNATKAKQKFNAESLQIQWSDAGADLKKQLEREIKIANAPNEVEKRKLQVGFYAEDKGITGAEVERLKDLASSAAMAGEAKKEAQKKSRDADSAGKKSASEALKSANAVADALKNQQAAVDRLNQGYKEGSVELAKYDAAKALGDDATPSQIVQAEKLAAEKFAIEQRSADQKAALDANVLAKAKQMRDDDLAQLERQLKAGDVTFEQSQKRRSEINAEYAKKAAEENAKSAVTPVQEMAAQVDPVQALANEHAQKLALIKDYMNQRVITEQQGLALMNAANKEYDEQRTAAQWQLLSQQSLGYDMLTSAVDSLSGNASNAITGLITQTMSWSDAARSLGNTMLNSVVNSIVQVGVEMAKNFILGQTLGVATQAANASAAVAGGAAALAAWTPAAIAASIATMGAASASGLGAYTAAQATGAATSIGMKALTIAGARKDGGPVSAGEMYRVGEGGKPEIFKASNGNQYMIPGDNGKVISNRDIGGGQVPVTVNINDYSSGGNRIDAQARQDSNGMTIDVFIADMDSKGPMHSAITRNTTASARVR